MNRRFQEVFWKVGERVFQDKIQATLYSVESGLDVEFSLFERAFDAANWEIDPEPSLEELLRRRALQLRESYDYLRLFYSGGSDSHTALESFVRNNIPLDEIVVRRGGPANDFSGFGDIEVNEVALPYLKSIESLIPKTKITILQTTPASFLRVFKDDYFHRSSSLTFRPFSEYQFHAFFPELELSGVHYCDIRGPEKPRIFLEDGIFFAAMWDNTIMHLVGSPHAEFFFLSPDMPELYIKQCHLLKKHVERKYPEATDLRFLYDYSDSSLNEINQSCRYPMFKSLTCGKSKGLLTPKCQWVLKTAHQTQRKLFDIYMEFLREEGEIYPQRFNNGDIHQSFVGYRSKRYRLGAKLINVAQGLEANYKNSERENIRR